MDRLLLQILSLIFVLINQQNDRSFRKREAAMTTLTEVGKFCNIRPILTTVEKSDKYSHEVRRRCNIVRHRLIAYQFKQFISGKYKLHPMQRPQRIYFYSEKLPGRKFYDYWGIETTLRHEQYAKGDYAWRSDYDRDIEQGKEDMPIKDYIEEQRYVFSKTEIEILNNLEERLVASYMLNNSFCRKPSRRHFLDKK